MSEAQWNAVDRYLSDLLVPTDAALDAALEASRAAGLPAHHVSPTQGRLLHVLARAQGARAILEIGTLGAYSTIWLARALPPGGRLFMLEADPACAEVARRNIARAGLAGAVDLHLGRALDTLPELFAAGCGPFDLIFIDADKANNPGHLHWALRLARCGSVIVADNVVRSGTVIDEDSHDPSVQGMRRFLELLGAEPRLIATAIQTVGSKGHDGFAIAVVIDGDDRTPPGTRDPP